MGKVKKFSTTGSKVRKMVLILAIIYTIIVVFKQQLVLSNINKEMEQYSEMISEIQGQNEHYKSEIEKLEDLDYIETIARKELGLIRESERIYIFSK